MTSFLKSQQQSARNLRTRLYPTSYEISPDKLQKQVRVRVVLKHVRVPVHVSNLNLSSRVFHYVNINKKNQSNIDK